MQQSHYNALLDLRDNASLDFSKQVLNAIVGVKEMGELPTMYYVEGGNSTWGTNYSGNFGAQINPPWNADRTILSPGTNAGENWGLAMQLNDFGPASMSRVTGLFVFLCYPIQLGGGELPNGALFTAVEKAESPDPFLVHSTNGDGVYYGVTEDTKLEFYKLARDVTYWSRHLDPDPHDLESAGGRLYAFFSQYPTAEVRLAEAVLSASKSAQDFEGSMQDYVNHMEKIQQLEQKADEATDLDDAQVKLLQTMLEDAYDQRDFKYQMLGGAQNQKKQDNRVLSEAEQEVNSLVQDLEATIVQIKQVDPQGDQIDVTAIIEPFNQRIEGILAHDPEIMKEVLFQVPSSASLDAQDSVDKLYRERFEALPQQFDSKALQAQ